MSMFTRDLAVHGGIGVAVLMLATLPGCTTTGPGRGDAGRIAELSNANTQLKDQLYLAERDIDTLRQRNAELEQDASFFEKRALVLEKEKSERVKELRRLRLGVRRFTDAVRTSLDRSRPEIEDYFGGELYKRAETEEQAGVLLVDREHRLPAGVTFTGGKAYVTGYARLAFCLLRPTAGDSSRVTVVAKSQPLEVTEPGLQTWTFFEPMAAQAGDMIGLYAFGPANIPYDAVGTGDVVVVETSEPAVGRSEYVLEFPVGRKQRAYSFGLVGYMRLFESPASGR